MADSDAENEKFVENVMHELQAFHITDRPKPNGDQDHADATTEDGNANGEGLSNPENVSESVRPAPTEGKIPTRVIKLSRPSTQFSSSRAQTGSQSETSVSASGNVNGVSSSSTISATAGSLAPGSRLAALQRPGSPFHKYLQRAQSPALQAAAKLTKPASVSPANATGDDINKENLGETETHNGEHNVNDVCSSDNKTDPSSNQTHSRSSIVPPKIQSSALTSSILLRRPQSPLHGSRNSQIPINRQVAGVATEDSETAGPKSPNSPKSDGPKSPGLTAASSITSADKVAIRNKLRANSFRLKDLLTKRPYGKARDEGEAEINDDSAAHKLTGSDRATSLPADNSCDGEASSKEKPRVSAVLLRSRSRTSGDRPPPTLISARSLRARSLDKDTIDSVSNTSKEVANDSNVSRSEQKSGNSAENSDLKAGNSQNSAVNNNHTQEETINMQSAPCVDNQGISESKITVGATLIRSPRTRISSSESPVPSDPNVVPQGHDISNDNQATSKDIQHIPQNSHDIPKDKVDTLDINEYNNEAKMDEESHDQNTNAKSSRNDNNASTAKSKAIADLEKEKEANLVFDSEAMGQSGQKTLNSSQDGSPGSPDRESIMTHLVGGASHEESGDSEKSDLKEIKDARKSAKESFLSQSMTSTSSTPRWRDWKQQRQRLGSEPGTSLTEKMGDTSKGRNLSTDDNKSPENVQNVDFSRASPALKRSLVVTDLDKAMIDRDQQKLSSIFKDGSQDNAEREDGTKPKGTPGKDLETDLDAMKSPIRATRSPKVQQKLFRSLDENPTSPTSPTAKTPPVYKPSVNLEDAVKWPVEVPGKLDFRKMEVFEGQMLLNWLTGSIDKSHYLRLVMTKHDISVIACQMCTCLIAAGVIKQLEGKDMETVFKPDCMYYWTHTQTAVSEKVVQDVNKLPPMWPPNLNDSPEKPGLKYTEAEKIRLDVSSESSARQRIHVKHQALFSSKDHQAAMVTLRHEYKDEVEKIQNEQQGVLDRARKEYETRLQQAIERIAYLQKEVEKYRCLAGIEKLTQAALSDADAARIEAGLQSDETQSNGYSSPSSGTPSVSQFHTPAVTPDCLSVDIPMNYEKSPNELFNDITTPNELRPGDGVPPAPPAPPAPPPYPGVVPPPPPPAPPPLGGPLHRNVSLKPVVNPKSPMKPLFWQRIQVHEVKNPKHKEYLESKLVWEDIKEEDVNIDELDEMFSKTALISSRRFSPVKAKAKVKEVAKIIIPKRSQTIGILLSSLRLEMSDIEDAILKFDTSQLSEEKLRQIYENRGSDDEIKKIKAHMKKHPDIPLDKPDQFLYDLSLIPDYAERIFCFIFQQAFQDSISVIESKMTNLRMTCRNLLSSVHIKKILGLVLALGNYMNGGNKSRGQADGFGIEILPKLKDVKSKDNMSSLLHYTVHQYIKKFEKNDAGTEKVSLPVPEASDMSQAMGVSFDELHKELVRIQKDFEAAEERAAKVIQSAKEEIYLQPFKDVMATFFEKGRQEFREQEDNLAEGKKIFQETVIFFCVKPKSGEKVVTPDYFFSLWAQFCQDFKVIWKREQQKLIKIRVKENELRVKRIQENMAKKPVRTRVRKAGGLKDRLAKQGLLES